jgi:hypothetical protein
MTAIVKIDKKIITQSVLKNKPSEVKDTNVSDQKKPLVFNEKISRPDELIGKTYKIKPPVSDHALYITISDIVMNQGTEHEERRPFEIFINCREMDHFQWIVSQTLMISALFRKGGDLTFITDEMKSVRDPNGGYFMKGGFFMPSLVAHIGTIIEHHLTSIGLIQGEVLSDIQKTILAEKRAQFEAENQAENDNEEPSNYPKNATLCKKCNEKAVILMDGCKTCLSCAASACG